MSQKLRRSGRDRKSVERFVFPEKKKRKTVKRKRETDDEYQERVDIAYQRSREDEQEMLATNLALAMKPFFLKVIKQSDLEEEKEKRRNRSLVQLIGRSQKVLDDNLIQPKSDNEYFVTSSDRKNTYVVTTTRLAGDICYNCNCGDRFIDHTRITCKHIMAVSFFKLRSIIDMYYQDSTPAMIQDVHDLEGMFDKMNVTKGHQNDYFSQLCFSPH